MSSQPDANNSSSNDADVDTASETASEKIRNLEKSGRGGWICHCDPPKPHKREEHHCPECGDEVTDMPDEPEEKTDDQKKEEGVESEGGVRKEAMMLKQVNDKCMWNSSDETSDDL
jgi:hypothetical protein